MRNLKTQTTKTTNKTYHEYIFDDMICPNEIINLSYSTIWSSSLEYSSPVFLSLLVGSDPSVLTVRVILESSKNRYDRLKTNARKQVGAYVPPFLLLSYYFLVIISTESKFIGGGTYILKTI